MHEMKSRKILFLLLSVGGFCLGLFILGYLRYAGIETSLSVHVAVGAAISATVLFFFYCVDRLGLTNSRRMIRKNWDLAGEKVELAESLAKLEETFYSTLKSVASAVDADEGHSFRVGRYAVKVGREMGFDGKELKALEDAALFHDMGMIWVPTHLSFSDFSGKKELDTVRIHPALGAEVLLAANAPQRAVAAVLHHHELYDGTGFPAGLKGEAIPLEARILAVADAFDRMTARNLKGESPSVHDAVEHLVAGAGTAFDPVVVEAFLSALDSIITAGVPEDNHLPISGPRTYGLAGNC